MFRNVWLLLIVLMGCSVNPDTTRSPKHPAPLYTVVCWSGDTRIFYTDTASRVTNKYSDGYAEVFFDGLPTVYVKANCIIAETDSYETTVEEK